MNVESADQLRQLVRNAERANASGQREEAARLIAQAQATAPDDPLVLNVAAVHAINGGEAAAARPLLERAIGQDDANPAFWVNLATACIQLGQFDEAMNALERALELDPRHVLALLQTGSLLERRDRRREAATFYKRALAAVPRGTQLPQSLRSVLQRGAEVVHEINVTRAAFVEKCLKDVREQHAGEHQERFDHCLQIMAGQRRLYRPRPTFMYFPHLPAYEFYARDGFPWLDAVEWATADIRTEFERVFTEDSGDMEPYVRHPAGVPLDQWAELNESRRWSAFYLWREGAADQEHLSRCPVTAAALGAVPLADVPEHGPNAFFSILDAKTRIPPHTGVTNTRLTVHVPLVIPPGCRFRVGAEIREWRPGEAWVFDDTVEHEAWNDSDVPRAVLIFDVWNPYLSDAERDLIRTATQAIGEYNRGQSS
ncbi:MAG: aspartyl/asparaginyl beta-hydroxylase domain-containing protein [Gammaproteobacteria bacterium]